MRHGFQSWKFFLAFFLVFSCNSVFSEEVFRLPEKKIIDIVDASFTPRIDVSPRGEVALLSDSTFMLSMDELFEPMLKLAGQRILPRFNIPQRRSFVVAVSLLDLKTGKQRPVKLPEGGKFGAPGWSPDGKRFAMTRYLPGGGEVWVFDAVSGEGKAVSPRRLNTVLLDPYQWERGGRFLLVPLFPENRGDPPSAPTLPAGPAIQETSGAVSKVRTYQDLLQTPHDEQLYKHFSITQIARVDLETGTVTNVGKPDLISSVSPSPEPGFLLVDIIREPFSRVVPAGLFAKSYQVWDDSGKPLRTLADLPVADQLPIEGVRTGMRSVHWQPLFPARLLWVEALDGGDPNRDVPFRDKLMALDSPAASEARELFRIPERFSSTSFIGTPGLALVTDYDRDRKWTRTWLFDTEHPKDASSSPVIFDRSIRDEYNDPGDPVTETRPDGQTVDVFEDGKIFLAGKGATPEGYRPFLRRFDLVTSGTVPLFQCASDVYEFFVDFADPGLKTFVTSRESPDTPPNYRLRKVSDGAGGEGFPKHSPAGAAGEGFPKHSPAGAAGEGTPLTMFPDPDVLLKQVKKELITYKRDDGVPLSGTLYYPIGYEKGKRYPAVVWAYPEEFTDVKTAGQVRTSTTKYSRIAGDSILFFALRGYAVLNDAEIPVVGDPLTANDTFVQQISAGAKAAVDKLVELGIADRERIGVAGHSYGAFMAANLLAHTGLFAAGIAKSGAYNRTLTPFGFQGERRTFWEASEVYMRLSPFTVAHKIDEPLLLIHGEDDPNPGTFPLQSERLFAGIRGHGGTARLVVLPKESHGYQARTSILHVLSEMFDWFDRHVKNRQAR